MSEPVAAADADADVVPIESPNVSTDLTTCPNSGPCLLCISDLEGCLSKSSAGVEQHTHFCSDEFFDALTKAMNTNPEMQIVFLGDYFDQGPHMVKSIPRIVTLFETFNKKGLDERVHIILGNRDVNKMRIPLEATLPVEELKSFTWVGGPKTTTIDDKSTPFEKTKQLIGAPPSLPNTYGASNLFKNLAAELNTKNVADVSDKEEVAAFKLFDTIFNISQDTDKTEFVNAVKNLFEKGKLIKIIDIGGTKFLASHAGTIHSCVFEDDILTRISNDDTFNEITISGNEAYFELIELFRKRLIFDEKNEGTPNMNEANIFYDNLLSHVVKSVFTNGIVESYKDLEFKRKYSLLQAFGLSGGDYFRSPIASCGVGSGCGKFVPPKPEFVTLLQNNNIKGCIHGHIPFCGTVPLLFKTPNANGIVEIACDTSNGNRPKQYNGNDVALHQVPLAIVYPSGAGITSITGVEFDNDDGTKNTVGTLSNTKTLGLSNDGTEQRYKDMIGFFDFNSFPRLESDKIIYPKGVFSFAAESGFKPANFKSHEESTTAVAAAAGGKRKTRRHKITKNKNKRNKKGKTLRNKRRTIRKR
jgi:hypothetical protein